MPVITNSEGKATAHFTVPANVPVGVKSVVAEGSGGTVSEGTYVAEGVITTRTLRRIRTIGTRRYDPLAQTFTLTENRMIGAVEIKFCSFGSVANDVICQIREVELGVPNQEVLGETRRSVVGLTTNTWVAFNFSVPVTLFADREYAIVLLTDDADHSVAISKLGDYVQAGNGPKEGFVTSQPYQVGVLLSSSNASTWTPHQDQDLTFRLMACHFTQSEKTVSFGDVTLDEATDFQFIGSVERTSPTTDVEFQLEDSNTAIVYRGPENQSFSVSAGISGDAAFRAVLTGDEKMSPVLWPNPQVISGTMGLTADYISRAIPAATTFTAVVIMEVFKPGAATIQPYVEVQRVVSGVDVVVSGVYQFDYAALTLDKRTAIGDGWFEEEWKITGQKGVGLDRETRLKISLGGTPGQRPKVRNLRSFIK